MHGALELGRRLRDSDLEAEAQQALGRVLIDRGSPRDGLEQLDEAMLLAVEGRLGPYSTGKVYCSLISACEQVGDYRRAAEWTEATLGGPKAIRTRCSSRACAECITRGHCSPAATGPALSKRSIARVRRAQGHESRSTRRAGYVELGELRRRFGDLAGAEDAFREAEALAGRPQSGLALVRLAQGQKAAATAIISARTRRGAVEPTRPRAAVARAGADRGRVRRLRRGD